MSIQAVGTQPCGGRACAEHVDATSTWWHFADQAAQLRFILLLVLLALVLGAWIEQHYRGA